jgi:lipopolysaccharide transport system permease protein
VAAPLTSQAAVTPARDDPRPDVPESHERPTIIIDGSAQWRRWFADLTLYSGALRSLAWRNVRSRYKQATLGMAWALVQPTVQVVVFTVIFGMMAKVPSGGLPYPLFALPGLLLWNLFARVVGDGSVSLVANQALVTKLFFPRIYLVIAAGASAIIDLLVSLLLLVVVMFAFDNPPGASAWLAAPALIGVLLLSYGAAALLSSLNARWRDVQHTIPFVLQIGLFVTPVLYQNQIIPDRWQWAVALNPMTAYIEVFRSSVLGLPLPASRVLLLSLITSLAVIVLGVWMFRRSEATVVDVV